MDTDMGATPPMTTKHTGFVDTPEPLPRQSAPVVSFLPVDTRHHATADISVVGPSGKTPCPQQHWQQIMGVLQWRNPAVSALLFLIGTFLALAGEFVLRGDHSVTPLKAVSVLCLADLALNFLRSMVSSSWQERAAWATSDFTRNTAEGAKQAVHKLAEWHDVFLSARNPVLTLRVAAAFSAASILGSYFSMWRLLCIAFYGAFACGAASEAYGPRITSAAQTASKQFKERWAALRLSRKQKAVALMAGVWVLWLNVNWVVRAQALLLGALVIRCNLKPAEVDAIISHAEPYVHSAKKRARRLSLAAGDMLRRHSSMHTSQPKAHNK